MGSTGYTLEEVEAIVSDSDSFNHFIEGEDSLQGQTLDLIQEVIKLGYELEGEILSDETMLNLLLDIVDANRHYQATHKGEGE